MATITSCKDCVAPQRHPGCHATCEKYIKAKAEYEAKKAIDDARKRTRQGLYEQRAAVVSKAYKKRRKGY